MRENVWVMLRDSRPRTRAGKSCNLSHKFMYTVHLGVFGLSQELCRLFLPAYFKLVTKIFNFAPMIGK